MEEEQEQQVVPQPVEVEAEEPDDLSDLTEVTTEDIMGDEQEDLSDLIGAPEPEDNSDLVNVSNEDIFGGESRHKAQPARQFKRTPKRYPPPAGGMGGIRQ